MTEKEFSKEQIREGEESKRYFPEIKKELAALFSAITIGISGVAGNVIEKVGEVVLPQPTYAAELSQESLKNVKIGEVRTWDDFLNYVADIYDTNKAIIVIVPENIFKNNEKELKEGRSDGINYKVVKKEGGKVFVKLMGKKWVDKNEKSMKLLAEEDKRLTEEDKRLTEEDKRLTEEDKRLTEEDKRLTEEEAKLQKELAYYNLSLEISNFIKNSLNSGKINEEKVDRFIEEVKKVPFIDLKLSKIEVENIFNILKQKANSDRLKKKLDILKNEILKKLKTPQIIV